MSENIIIQKKQLRLSYFLRIKFFEYKKNFQKKI